MEGHPGGDKILLAAGASIDPYWNVYQIHNTPETVEMLEELRIGNLDEKDVVVEELKVISCLAILTISSKNLNTP